MAIFYHISTNLQFNGYFYPRIPNHRHKEQEDSTIKRVCVSPSIEDCLSAIPDGGSGLDELNCKQRGYYRVYRIDTAKLGIPEDNIILSDTLYEKDLVRDADITNEVWITKECTINHEDSYIIKVNSWEETTCDLYPYSLIQIAEDEYDGDIEEAYYDTYEESLPWATKIFDLNYWTDILIKGDTIPLYFESEREATILKEWIINKQGDIKMKEDMDALFIESSMDINISDLYETHWIST